MITEGQVEQMVLRLLQRQGYELTADCMVNQPPGEAVLVHHLQNAVAKINAEVPTEIQQEAIRQVLSIQSTDLIKVNERFHKQLTEGILVVDSERKKIHRIWLADFQNYENNTFSVVNQLTIKKQNGHRIVDIVLFINGLPLVLIEIKKNLPESFEQLQEYKKSLPELCYYNALLVVTNGESAKAGSITNGWSQFRRWSPSENNRPRISSDDDCSSEIGGLFCDMLNKKTLLDLIKHFTVFGQQTQGEHVKTIAAYHQYHAVNRVFSSTLQARLSGKTRAGVVWHTAGSGKSLTMLFYAGKIIAAPQLDNPTVIILTDRVVVEEQLIRVFDNFHKLINQIANRVDNRAHLQSLLASNGGEVIITTIHKFMPKHSEVPNTLTERRNIIVIVDEASRSQQGVMGMYVRNALPNAIFVGFTSVPFEKGNQEMYNLFGEYVDIYDMRQAVQDGTVVPVFFERRLSHIALGDERVMTDCRTSEITEEDELAEVKNISSAWIRNEAMTATPLRLKQVASDIIHHFEQRNKLFDSNGLIVCLSREICIKLHNEIIKIRPEWYSSEDYKGAIKVIMTGSPFDPLEWQEHIRSNERINLIGQRLKNPKDELKLAIVRDMWLTGFDAPCLNTVYLDRPMAGHQLLKLIAQVHHVYKNKNNGLIVDYAGNEKNLQNALIDYQYSGAKGEAAITREDAINKTDQLYKRLIALFPKFNCSEFATLEPNEKNNFLLDAADYILGFEKEKKEFDEILFQLSSLLSIWPPLPNGQLSKKELSIFYAINAIVSNVENDETIEPNINPLVKKFMPFLFARNLTWENVRSSKTDFFSKNNQMLLKDSPRKNLTLSVVRKLMGNSIELCYTDNENKNSHYVKLLNEKIKFYEKGILSVENSLENLISFAKEIEVANKTRDKLNLSSHELPFYQALDVENGEVALLGGEVLLQITKEIIENLKGLMTIDWIYKESVQAKMRMAVKRTFMHYHYPPSEQKQAVERIMDVSKSMAEIM